MTVATSTADEPVVINPPVADDTPIENGTSTKTKTTVADDEMDKKCRSMLSNLTDDEKEHAARSSYRYFIASTSSGKDAEDKPTEAERDMHAMAMARRHLAVVKKHDEIKALANMKATIQYRREWQLDELRKCFYHKSGEDGGSDEETDKMYANMRSKLEEQMSTGKMMVRGYDTDGRSLYPVIIRYTNSFDPEWYMKIYMYTMERALACTERNTDGKQDRCIVMFDYREYGFKHDPPISLVKQLLYSLRDHWPERLEHVFLVDTPLIYRIFWMLVKPFIDPITKAKVKFITGEKQKEEMLKDIVGLDQAMPFMLPDGKKTRELDVHEFLYDIPFDHAYDED